MWQAEGDNFLSTIVTGFETWFHHFEPETKRQSIEWHHTTTPQKKKFKTIPSASKIIVSFWDCEGVIIIDMLPRGQTINSNVYVETLKKHFQRVHPHKDDKNASSP
jgi:hypothetical protein